MLHHLAAQTDQISDCVPSVQAVGILYKLGIELSRFRGDVPWWRRWVAQFTRTTIDSDMAYRPARYRYCHFYAAHLIQRHFRNVKKGEEAGNLFDADVEFWAQLIYDSPENRAMQTPEQVQVLFSQLQLKYWQSLCRAIEIKMAPKWKKKDPPTKVVDFCLEKGTKVRHATRGPGEVVALDWNEKRGKPVFVQFENGEVHHYSMESAAKLEIASGTMTKSGANDGISGPMSLHPAALGSNKPQSRGPQPNIPLPALLQVAHCSPDPATYTPQKALAMLPLTSQGELLAELCPPTRRLSQTAPSSSSLSTRHGGSPYQRGVSPTPPMRPFVRPGDSATFASGGTEHRQSDHAVPSEFANRLQHGGSPYKRGVSPNPSDASACETRRLGDLCKRRD